MHIAAKIAIFFKLENEIIKGKQAGADLCQAQVKLGIAKPAKARLPHIYLC